MTEERSTDLSQVLFSVEQRPILIENKIDQPCLFPHQNASGGKFSRVAGFRAIVDVERGHVFSVVADGYRLVSNEEAIDLGKECFRKVFNESTAEGMEVFNIIAPKTRSFCHIDYIHRNGGFEPWQNDRWVPFLRVTNSYNRTKPLRFDLGFCRWICTNGMIFRSKSITFRYLHTRGEIARGVEFHTTFGEIKVLEREFAEKLHNLKRYYIPKEFMLPLACRVFKISATPEDISRPKRRERLIEFRNRVTFLTNKYFEEMGPNGYAALNVISDVASRPKFYISDSAVVDQLQKSSGDWVDGFIREIKNDGFSFEDYLGDYQETAEVLHAANG